MTFTAVFGALSVVLASLASGTVCLLLLAGALSRMLDQARLGSNEVARGFGRRLGLVEQPDGRVAGAVSGIEVRATVHPNGTSGVGYVLEVGPSRPDTWFRAREAHAGAETGDLTFDQHVALRTGLPALSRPTRKAVFQVVLSGVRMEAGMLRFAGVTESVDALEELVRKVVDAAARVRDEATGLDDLASGDPDAAVRELALRRRLGRTPGPEPAWLRERSRDPEPRVAVVAATALGDAVRLRGLLGGPAGYAALRALVGMEGAAADPDVQRALARWIRVSPNRELLGWAGAVGTPALVSLLQEVGGDAAPSARSAVRVIQSRAQGERGGLALVDVVGGEVSVAASDPRGRVADGGPT